jgi:transcription elongation factor GreB
MLYWPSSTRSQGLASRPRPTSANGNFQCRLISSETDDAPLLPTGDGRGAAALTLLSVSKAFTKDDDPAAPQFVRSRLPLPRGVPNYVTARGLAALRDERARLEAERARCEAAGDAAAAAALGVRMVELDARIGSALVVAPPAGEGRDTIRFGASVVVRGDGDRGGRGIDRCYQIVGVDEADAASGRIAFTAPLARALLGRRVGDVAQVETAHGEESWVITGVAYDDASGPG